MAAVNVLKLWYKWSWCFIFKCFLCLYICHYSTMCPVATHGHLTSRVKSIVTNKVGVKSQLTFKVGAKTQ
jgi:hypothetical protein